MAQKEFECVGCKKPVSRRKSLAVVLDPRQDADYVIARGKKSRSVVTRKALPRRHRGKCPD